MFQVPLPKHFIITAQHEDYSDPKPLAGPLLPLESWPGAVHASQVWALHIDVQMFRWCI